MNGTTYKQSIIRGTSILITLFVTTTGSFASNVVPPFCWAILTKESIDLKGGVIIDSFDSSNSQSSTGEQYDPAKRRDKGNIASVADTSTEINETGSAKVFGRAATGPSGQIDVRGNAAIGSIAWIDDENRGIEPGYYSNDLNIEIPDAHLPGLDFEWLPRNPGTVGGTNYSYILPTGNYRQNSDFTLTSDRSMVIDGDVVLYFKRDFDITGSGFVYLTSGSTLTIYLGGSAKLSGQGVVNGTGLASRCQLVGLSSSASIDYTGSTSFIGTIYAPEASVKLSGGGATDLNFVGAVVARTATLTGSYEFHFDEGLCDSGVIPPIARDDAYRMLRDESLSVPAPGILANDQIFGSQAPTILLEQDTQHGRLELQSDGSFGYVPDAGFSGTDAFTYRISDGQNESNLAKVTIIVTPVDDNAPIAVADDGYSTPEDTLLTVPANSGVLVNDSDPDGDPITALLETDALHGSVQLSPDGSFTYLPDADYNGPDSFTYRASDGVNQSTPATVSIIVTPVDDDAPIAVADDGFSTPEDTLLTVPAGAGVLINDSDPDGDPLTALLETDALHGTVQLSPDGSFTYLPDADYNGPDSFTYRASDGVNQSPPATVSITVTPVDDDAPIAVADDGYSTPEDTLLTVPANSGVLVNDSDPDGDPLTALLETDALHGSVQLSPDGSFTYLPDTDYNGPDSFTYRASDGVNQSTPATVSIIVTPVDDDAPIAVADDGFSTPEDTLLTVPAGAGVLINDSDPDGDPLTALLETDALHGSVQLSPDGSFTYLPDADYNGPDSFTYRASDGVNQSTPATVSITVTPVADPLIARPDAYTTQEDTVLSIAAPGVLGNDSYDGNDLLTAELEDLPSSGSLTLFATGRFIYQPNADFSGSDSFTYRAHAGGEVTSPVLVSIDVTPVDDPPVANPDAYQTTVNTTLTVAAPGILANDVDPDGDPLTAAIETQPSHGSLNPLPDGSFSYIPESDFEGDDFFTYRANDGSTDSDPAMVTLMVGDAVGNPNALGNVFEVNEDAILTIAAAVGVLSDDTPVLGGGLLAFLESNVQRGGLSLSADGSLTYIPNQDYFGSDTFFYRASNGAVSVGPIPVTINVNPVNDAPSFVGGADQLVNQGSGLRVIPGWANDISAGPENESDQLVGFIVESDNNTVFSVPPSIDANGDLRYSPAPTRYGLANVSVVAIDTGGTANGGQNISARYDFTVLVNAVPTVDVVSPNPGNIYFPHQIIPFEATADDIDGFVTNVVLRVDGESVAAFENEPYEEPVSNLPPGLHSLTAMATDNLGANAVSSPVTLTVIPGPPVTPLNQEFNFQVDLSEQIVRVDNPTPYAIPAVRVLVTDLPPNVSVFNASGTTEEGIPYVQYNQAVPARSSIQLTIEYLTPLVQTIQATLLGEVAEPVPDPAPAVGELIEIKRMSCFPDGRVLLTFDSIQNRIYNIEYSEDLENWKTAFPPITAIGDGIQWVDNGWPKTEGHPGEVDERFYRVRLAPVQ